MPSALKKDDPDAYELAMRQAELSYNVEKTEHVKEIKKYNLQKQQLAGEMVGKCATSVITKLEQAPDWKKIKLEDPVEVLKRIKDIVFNYKGVKNGYELIHSSAKGLSELKQRDGESTKDWAERVIQGTAQDPGQANGCWGFQEVELFPPDGRDPRLQP